jgi:hypothetical protein
MLTGAVFAAMHGKDGDSLRGVTPDSDDISDHVKIWRDSRARPLQLTIPGAALTSIGAGLLAASDVRIPLWVAAVSGVAAVSLLSYGAVELVHGEPCPDSLMADEQHACSRGLDRGDKGAVLMVAAAPFAVLPVAMLIRHWVSPLDSADESARWHVTPSLAATPRTLALTLEGAWF